MALVMISRGSLIGAQSVAMGAAESLGIPTLSREDVLIAAASDLGVEPDVLAEELQKPPFFLERWSRERESHIMAVRATLLERALECDFVYHGYAANLLLSDVPGVLRVRVVAPLEMRVAAVMKERDCDRDQAVGHIHRIDRQRKKWARFLYDVDWGDPELYDLTLNLERLSIEDASSAVVHLARLEKFRTTEARRRRIEDLTVTARVQCALGLNRTANLEISSQEGLVTIRGWIAFRDEEERIREVTSQISGVSELDCELSVGTTLF